MIKQDLDIILNSIEIIWSKTKQNGLLHIFLIIVISVILMFIDS